MMPADRRNQAAFTLIELLVVIAIIAILAAMPPPASTGSPFPVTAAPPLEAP